MGNPENHSSSVLTGSTSCLNKINYLMIKNNTKHFNTKQNSEYSVRQYGVPNTKHEAGGNSFWSGGRPG